TCWAHLTVPVSALLSCSVLTNSKVAASRLALETQGRDWRADLFNKAWAQGSIMHTHRQLLVSSEQEMF
ncbi:hypothetical protein NDU88_006981, partial [Pleurodeles waltl]